MRTLARAAELPRVFRGRDAVAAGALTSADLRGPHVGRLLNGVYSPSSVQQSHTLVCEAAGLLLPPEAMLTGASAATVRGLPWLRRGDDVEVVMPDGGRHPAVRGVRVRRSSTPLEEGRPWRTTQLAPAERMAFDAAARVPLTSAVGRLDALARAGAVDLGALARWLVGRTDQGVARVRSALELTDPRAESLPESAVRVLLHRAGIPVEVQVVVHAHGRAVARVDLAVVDQRVAIEYDGAWHGLREQLERDRDRLNRLREAGWVVVHVTAADLADPPRLVALVRAALVGR